MAGERASPATGFDAERKGTPRRRGTPLVYAVAALRADERVHGTLSVATSQSGASCPSDAGAIVSPVPSKRSSTGQVQGAESRPQAGEGWLSVSPQPTFFVLYVGRVTGSATRLRVVSNLTCNHLLDGL